MNQVPILSQRPAVYKCDDGSDVNDRDAPIPTHPSTKVDHNWADLVRLGYHRRLLRPGEHQLLEELWDQKKATGQLDEWNQNRLDALQLKIGIRPSRLEGKPRPAPPRRKLFPRPETETPIKRLDRFVKATEPKVSGQLELLPKE